MREFYDNDSSTTIMSEMIKMVISADSGIGVVRRPPWAFHASVSHCRRRATRTNEKNSFAKIRLHDISIRLVVNKLVSDLTFIFLASDDKLFCLFVFVSFFYGSGVVLLLILLITLAHI